MTWFESLTGFPETSGELVRANLKLDGGQFTSLANNRSFHAGEFTTPRLKTLRQANQLPSSSNNTLQIEEIVADVQSLHQDSQNANAVFQVASQFNCLEMAAPHMTPEDGVGIYQNDWTQGPACCICAGGGTIYRNYFVQHNGARGQTSQSQLDCLEGISRHFNNSDGRYWVMENGYCFPTPKGLAEIEQRLANS